MKRFLQVLLAVLFFWRWPAAYRRHIANITASGHMCRPSGIIIFFARLAFRFMTFLWVGRVRVVDEKYLFAGERVIATPNHSSMLDAVILFAALRKPVWAIGADDMLRKAGGLIGLVATKIRTMPVDRTHGKTVIAPAIELMSRGNSLLMFPEGKISPTGVLLPFKAGPAVIGRGTMARVADSGGRVALVPVAICYKRRDIASAFNYFAMGLKWRKGATVVCCPPIWLDEHPDLDPSALMELVKVAINNTLRAYNAA